MVCIVPPSQKFMLMWMLGHTPTTSAMATSPTQAPSGTLPAASGDQVGAASQKMPAKNNGGLSTEQMRTLQSQIMAFKMLTKNTAIPPQLQQQLFKSQQSKQPPQSPKRLLKLVRSWKTLLLQSIKPMESNRSRDIATTSSSTRMAISSLPSAMRTILFGRIDFRSLVSCPLALMLINFDVIASSASPID